MKFFDIDQQYLTIRKELLRKIDSTFRRGDFILGQDVREFEKEFAKFCNTKYAIGLNSGTDALFLSLKALGIRKGNEVIVPAFTFIATSFAVNYTGARPVFVDVDRRTYNIDAGKIEKAITKKTKAIIPVHLFGLCADMPTILKIAKKHKLFVVEDAAQAHGAKINNVSSGSMGDFGCFSFYPTKNLGAFGDAGLITTNSSSLYKIMLKLRDCGREKERYLHPMIGYNSRLDNIQALILKLKLKYIDQWTEKRIDNAKLYHNLLKDAQGVGLPETPNKYKHVFHAFSILTTKRKVLINKFRENNIPYSVFYQLPLHLQEANKQLGYKKGDFPIAEQISKDIISLPIHPSLTAADIKKVATTIKEVHNG